VIEFLILFTSADKRSGFLDIYETANGKKLHVTANGILPTPDVSSISGDYDVEGFEETLGRILQRLVEAQLLQTP